MHEPLNCAVAGDATCGFCSSGGGGGGGGGGGHVTPQVETVATDGPAGGYTTYSVTAVLSGTATNAYTIFGAPGGRYARGSAIVPMRLRD